MTESSVHMDRPRTAFYIEGLLLLAILALGGFLRLSRLSDQPGWYSDEGTILNIADNLSQGRIQYLALTRSTLLAARMPLFPALLATLTPPLGPQIETLRSLTGVLGTLSIAMLYLLVRRCLGSKGAPVALVSAFLLATYPTHVLYSRLGFSYNLLAPIYLAVVLCAWEYLEKGWSAWLLAGSMLAGVGALSDLSSLTLVLPLAIVAAYRRPRALLWSLPATFLPLAGYLLVALIRDAPAILFDLTFILTRLGEVPLIAQFPVAAYNFAAALMYDPWFALGVVGLFLLRGRFGRLCLVAFWLPFLAISRSTTDLAGLGYYYLIPLLPLVAVGVGVLLVRGSPWVLATIQQGLRQLLLKWGWDDSRRPSGWTRGAVTILTGLAVFLIAVGPPLILATRTTYQIQHNMQTAIDHVMISPFEARATLDFLEERLAADDLVIASPALAWAVPSRAADFQQALAASGIPTVHYPTSVPPDRFAFDARFESADFVVIDRIWDNWAAPKIEGVRLAMADIATWPLVYSQGEFRVYENPRRAAE